MPTLTLIVIVTLLMQSSLIIFSTAVIKTYKGVREAALATFLIAMGFVVIRVGNMSQIEQRDSGFISNLFIMAGFALFYLAVCRFVGEGCNRWLTFGFVPLVFLVLTIAWSFRIAELPMIYISATTTFVLNLASAYNLYRSDTRRYRLAAALTGIPLFTYGLIAFSRMVLGYFKLISITPGPTYSAIVDVFALFVFSYLWSSGFVLMISQRLQGDLNDLAMNDALTRVHNRRAMQDMLDFEMQRIDEDLREFSIILLDVDHFKKVNDTHGHTVGDLVLQWLASTLQSKLRVQDVIARWGGEEFLILLPDTTLETGLEIGERLRSEIATEKVATETGELRITFSAGVANSNKTREVGELCKIADKALYLAKQTRNTIASDKDVLEAEKGA